jgi:hypothetical protein
MNSGLVKFAAVSAAAALTLSGCQSMSPGENAAVFGGLSGLAAGGLARASGMSTAESIATGAAVGAVVAVTTYIIAKHQATERQRRIAEQRARVAYARMEAQRQREGTTVSRAGKKVAAKKRPRYIAVDTEKNEKTSPKAKKSVMLWDTQSKQIVGNDVYDVEMTPAVGERENSKPTRHSTSAPAPDLSSQPRCLTDRKRLTIRHARVSSSPTDEHPRIPGARTV